MPNEPKIIPVVDILNGVAVQAIAGRREDYQPVLSQLTDSIDPSVVLKQMCDTCESDTAYLADLDAILHRKLNRCVLAELAAIPLDLMVDIGVRSCNDVQTLMDLGYSQVIIALESLPGPEIARDLLQTYDPQSLILSLDMKAGVPMSAWKPWVQLSALDLLHELSSFGFQRWILLDLSAVGTHSGVPTTNLCREWRLERPHDEIITGGGISNRDDLASLKQAGVNGALVATALHSGSF